jgi:hypothetical protein
MKTTDCANYDDLPGKPEIIVSNVSTEFRMKGICGNNASDVSLSAYARGTIMYTCIVGKKKNNAIQRLEEVYEFLAEFPMLFRSRMLSATHNNECSSDSEFASSVRLPERTIIRSMANVGRPVVIRSRVIVDTYKCMRYHRIDCRNRRSYFVSFYRLTRSTSYRDGRRSRRDHCGAIRLLREQSRDRDRRAV